MPAMTANCMLQISIKIIQFSCDINVYDKYTLNKHVDFGRTVKSRVSEELGEC